MLLIIITYKVAICFHIYYDPFYYMFSHSLYFKWMSSLIVSVLNVLLKGNGIVGIFESIVVEQLIKKFFCILLVFCLNSFKEENNHIIKS